MDPRPTESGYPDVSRAQPHATESVERRQHRGDKLRPLTKKSSLSSNMDALATPPPVPIPSGTKHTPPPPPPPPTPQQPHPLGDSRPLSLAAFAQRYSNHLPAEIVVTRGGSCTHMSLACEDTLEVHQIRELSIVHSSTNDSSRHFKIPLNLPIEFCLLYDPENNLAKTVRGYTFERVSDLMSASPRPRLVCARATWEGKASSAKGAPRVTIDDREVLVVGEVVPPAKKKNKRHLRMYSITRQVEKVIPEDCVGNFCTKPVLLPLYLPEITGYVKDPFPCKAVVQEEGLVVQPGLTNLVRELSGRVLTLTTMTKEVALVTTLVKGEGADTSDGSYYPVITEIPVDMPQIQISVLSFTCEKETESDSSFTGVSSSSAEGKDDEDHYEIMFSSKLWDLSSSLATHKTKPPPPLPPPPPRQTNIRPRSTLIGCDRLSSPPPPVPTRPTPADPNLPPPKTSTPPTRPSDTHEPLSPRELVKLHGHALPVQVTVVSGYHGTQGSLLRDEVYKVHLLTDTEGVSVTDERGSLFLVPVDSMTLFGVVFNPFNDFQGAIGGYTFDTVSDIVNSRQLPCVVGVTAPHRGASAEKSVEPGDVLIVGRVERVGQGETTLIAYSCVTMATKRLSWDCRGCFTTCPASVKLTLALILEHVPCVLPTCAVAYGDISLATTPTGAAPSLQRPTSPPPHLSPLSPSSPTLPPIITLLKRHPKGVLVATTVQSQKAIWNPYAPTEIPLDLPVKVVLAPRGVRRVTVRGLRPRSQCITHSSTHQNDSTGTSTHFSPVRRGGRDMLPAPLPPKCYQQLLRVPYQVSIYQRIIRSMADQALLQGVKGTSDTGQGVDEHPADTDQGVDEHHDNTGKLPRGVKSRQGGTQQAEDTDIQRGDENESSSSSFSVVVAMSSSSGASTDSFSPAKLLRSPGCSENVPSPSAPLPPKPTTVAIGRSSCEQLEGFAKVLGGGEGEGGGGGGSGQFSSGGPLVKPRSLSDQSSSQVSLELTNKSLSASSQLSCDQPAQSELNEKVVELSRQLEVLTAQLGTLQEKIDTMNRCLFVSSGCGHCGPHPLTGCNENQRFLASLTSAQVLDLLDAVGLSMHKEQFERERVDGRLLCKCSDQVLRDDLKMASQLHRLKLLSYISGEVNVVEHFMPQLQNGAA